MFALYNGYFGLITAMKPDPAAFAADTFNRLGAACLRGERLNEQSHSPLGATMACVGNGLGAVGILVGSFAPKSEKPSL
jgi:hypothetical protein